MRFPGATIYRGLAAVAADRPDEPALIDGERTWTYDALLSRSRELAGGLQSLGLESGDTVAVWLANRPAWVLTHLATSYLGAAVVAVDTRSRTHELEHILTDAGCRVLVTESRFLETDYLSILADVVPGIQTEPPGQLDPEGLPLETVLAVDAGQELSTYDAVRRYEDVVGHTHPLADPATDAEAAEAIFYTSGTTGKPKGCVHPARSVLEHSAAVGAHLGVTEEDVVLGALPFPGVWGYNTWLMALAREATLVIQRPFEPAETARLVRTHDVTCLSGMAVMFTRTIDTAGTDWSDSLERGVICFLTLSYDEATFERIEAAVGFPLVQPYGLSEANSQVFVGRPGDSLPSRKRVGGPLVSPEQEAKIIDPASGERLPEGESGELCLRGYNVMTGYLGRPEATEEAFEDDWLHTGDLCSREGEALVYHSRLDDALRVRGFLVTPREVEVAIDEVHGVIQSQVVGVSNDRHGEVPVAFVRRDDPHLDTEELRSTLEDRIADYKVPAHVEFVQEFPRIAGPHGEKVRKTDLRDRARTLDIE